MGSTTSAKLEAFATQAIGELTSAYTGVMVSLGSKLGLYKVMAGAGPSSARRSHSVRVAPNAMCVSG